VRSPADPAPDYPRRVRPVTRPELAVLAGLAVLFGLGLARAAQLAWVCDDAFISLRYAQNLVQGHGLVWNPGERVEGYTNLLWTLLLAGLLRLGVPDLRAAELPGLVAYAALALVLARASWRRSRAAGLPFLPIAAAIVLASDDFHVWATGGLETLLFACLTSAALLLVRLRAGSVGAAAAAGALLALLVLTRPDGVLFAAAGIASPWLPPGGAGRERLRVSLATAAPVALVLAVLVPWKLAYYGELLPTAFYAKSAARPYVSQGLVYVGLYLAKNWFLVAAGALALGAWIRRGRRAPAAPDPDAPFLLATAALFTAYLVWVGGDFMFARRILPAVPLVLFALEGAVLRVAAPRARALLAAAAVAAAALPVPVYARYAVINHVADERRFYPKGLVEARRAQGEAIGRALAGLPARVAVEGGLLSLAYWSRLPYVVEITGLTQYSLAKAPLAERGVIGHEKLASADWFTENRVHLIVRQVEPPVPREAGAAPLTAVRFGDLALADLLFYEDAVMEPLRARPGVEFVPIERVLARTRRELRSAPLADAERVYASVRRVYLRQADPRSAAADRELREILEARRREGR
jgi:hypothetical protein